MKNTMRMTPEGTRDLLFEECLARRELAGRLTALFESRGFSEVMTPGIEFFDVFSDGAIPAEKMYKLTDSKGRLLVLRPDSTTPIARLAATRLQSARLPLRLYYAQDVFRSNHGLTGRSDIAFQAGVELIGVGGERADLEVIALAAESLARCSAADYKLEIGHVGFFEGLLHDLGGDPETCGRLRSQIEMKNYAALSALLDSLPPGRTVDAVRRLPRLFGGEEVLEEAKSLVKGNEQAAAALASLSRIYRQLREIGLERQVMVDLGLLHPNEYYTGVIFRGYAEGSAQGRGETVMSGGRYDALQRQFGSSLPATGFAVEIDPLTKAMLAQNGVKPPAQPQILVHAAENATAAGLRKVAELTAAVGIAEFSVFDTLEEALAYAAGRDITTVIALDRDTVTTYINGRAES
ncbi:MAG: ATP phosphoribosyltransferase regulatory subunit [Oscillospiraceae bacterium]|nr:ATP phosphoribosyltransferase regulatory subunit [Oscillospiraceae bacterium]